MKMYKRFYEITIRDKDGQVVYVTEAFSGNEANERVFYIHWHLYPTSEGFTSEVEFKEVELEGEQA